MSLALYRKYRPGRFEDMVGQDAIVETLRRQVAAGQIAHAYLFTGSRGTGKTSSAKILAKAVNCLEPDGGDPCGVCTCCRGIDDGSLTDVSEIDAASNNGVDSIRELREEAFYTPAIARYRVYIIDEVHMLSQSAFNALLKIMEEPPEHVIFILSTTEIHKVLPTIISRCQRYDFRRIDSDVIAQRLRYIAGQEAIELTEDGAMQIARLSDGALRDALSLLDVCRAGGGVIDAVAVAAAAGLSSDEHLFELSGYLLGKQVAESIELVERMAGQSLEPGRLCEQLMEHMRALMLVKTVAEPRALIGCMPETLERFRAQAKGVPLGAIMAILSELGQVATAISRTTAKRMELELGMVRLCAVRAESVSDDTAGLMERMETLERLVASFGTLQSVQASVVPDPTPPITPTKENTQPQRTDSVPKAESILPSKDSEIGAADEPLPEPPPEEPMAEAVPAGEAPEGAPIPFEAWEQVLVRLESINRMNAGLLRGSKAYLAGKRVLIDCKDPVFLDLMRTKEDTREHIKKAIYLTTGQQFAIGPYRSTEEPERRDPLMDFIKALPKDENIVIK